MKTWKQLEAMARKIDMTLDVRRKFCAIDQGTIEIAVVSVEAKLAPAQTHRILRTMIEAALKELSK